MEEVVEAHSHNSGGRPIGGRKGRFAPMRRGRTPLTTEGGSLGVVLPKMIELWTSQRPPVYEEAHAFIEAT